MQTPSDPQKVPTGQSTVSVAAVQASPHLPASVSHALAPLPADEPPESLLEQPMVAATASAGVMMKP
jgi:hypothetical protein